MNKAKDESIEFILEQGLQKPKSTWRKMSEIVRTLGYRHIFWDTSYGLFITMITLLLASIIFITLPEEFLFTAATIIAPIIFLIVLLFTEMSERISGLYELKQTFHFSIIQITALRIIAYSLAGFILTMFIILFSTENRDEFLLLFSLSLFGLSICATFSLFLIRRFSGKWGLTIFAIAWMIPTMMIPLLFGIKKWENFCERCLLLLLLFLLYLDVYYLYID